MISAETIDMSIFEDCDTQADLILESALNTLQAGEIDAIAMDLVMDTLDTAWANGDRERMQYVLMNIAASACMHDHLRPFAQVLGDSYARLEHVSHDNHSEHDKEKTKKKDRTKTVSFLSKMFEIWFNK